MVITLRSADGWLILQEKEEYWWQLTVRIGATDHVLGSDTRQVIVSRLREGLKLTLGPKTAGLFSGIPAVWVLSLSERHGSVYAGDLDGVRYLFFQDANGTMLGSVRLSPRDRMVWCAEIERHLEGT